MTAPDAPPQPMDPGDGGPLTFPRQLLAAAHPKTVLAMANGYPPGVKQFLWFCLILVYPAWLFFLVIAWPFWLLCKAGEWLLVGLFWPLRVLLRRGENRQGTGRDKV